MKKTLVAPLALLASLSVISSCSQKETPTPSANTGSAQGTMAPEMPAPSPVNPPATPSEASPAPSPMPAPAQSPIPPTSEGPASPTPTSAAAQPVVMTRTETVAYANPSGRDEVEFSVTVTDGIITSATVTPKATNQVSQKLQTAFAGEVAAKVVGMKTENFDIDAVGGASLTTGAFEVFIRSL